MKGRILLLIVVCLFSMQQIFASGHTVGITKTDVKCNGESNGSAIAKVSGGIGPFIYSWSNAATGATVNGLTAGSYQCTVTDNNDMSASVGYIVITEPAQISFNASTVPASCGRGHGGIILTNIIGGTQPYSYQWSGPTNFDTPSSTWLLPGIYTGTITDANGCTIVTTQKVDTIQNVSIAVSGIRAGCGKSNGSATVVASGGQGVYHYTWSNNSTNQTISTLPAGKYIVTVSDDNYCVKKAAIFLNDTSAGIVTVTLLTNIKCAGGNDGSMSASVTGGTPGYIYQWSNAATGSANNNLVQGDYCVTVTDGNGCRSISESILTEPDGIVFYLYPKASTCGQSNGNVSVSVYGGTGLYTYSWNNGAANDSVSGLIAGIYTFTVTDANGCSKIGNAYINNDVQGCTVGMREQVKGDALNVYPNPASGTITVDVNILEIKVVQLVNILGETVLLINSNIGNKFTIDIQSLPPGIYYLSVVSLQERIVKQVQIIR